MSVNPAGEWHPDYYPNVPVTFYPYSAPFNPLAPSIQTHFEIWPKPDIFTLQARIEKLEREVRRLRRGQRIRRRRRGPAHE